MGFKPEATPCFRCHVSQSVYICSTQVVDPMSVKRCCSSSRNLFCQMEVLALRVKSMLD